MDNVVNVTVSTNATGRQVQPLLITQAMYVPHTSLQAIHHIILNHAIARYF